MNSLETLTVEEWDKKYAPIRNIFDDNASWGGIMYETYGDDLNLVLKYDDRQLWTYIDGEAGTYLVTGYKLVNRIGYFICANRWEHENIQVVVSEDS